MQAFDWGSENVRRAVLLGAVLLLVALIVQGVFGANGLFTLRREQQEARGIQRHIQLLQKENASLQQQVRGLQSNPDTIGKYAREYLHMARPGEVIYVLPKQGKLKPPHKSSSSRDGPAAQ
jgi:cell division protein FtsB